MKKIKAVSLYEMERLIRSVRFYVLLSYSFIGSLISIRMRNVMHFIEKKYVSSYILEGVYIGFPIIIMILAMDLISCEYENRHAELIFSKPLRKMEFVLGKICATIILFMLNVALSAIFILLYMYFICFEAQDLITLFSTFISIVWGSIIPLSITVLINALLINTVGTFAASLIAWYILDLAVTLINPSNILYNWLPNVAYRQILADKHATAALTPIIYIVMACLIAVYMLRKRDIH